MLFYQILFCYKNFYIFLNLFYFILCNEFFFKPFLSSIITAETPNPIDLILIWKCSDFPPVSPSIIRGLDVTSRISFILLSLAFKSSTSISGFLLMLSQSTNWTKVIEFYKATIFLLNEHFQQLMQIMDYEFRLFS